ncbi:MAG: hypothetical protein FD187_2370 [bacterium]|nr:MAG: hypothetical protein FD142_1013 [bacterium]KAF0147939.1 MAG: hypothetical protein FD187_2370 [bacterium]KAF0168121.1 MAG: hypothetical protein FD158_1669 [bacterium]TXT22580.1 MAG: hypothetical protein FD132_390 [bacterium]
MATKDCTTHIADIGEAINRIYRIAAMAQGANALLASNEGFPTEEIQSGIFLVQRIEADLRQLAERLDEFDLSQSPVAAQPA